MTNSLSSLIYFTEIRPVLASLMSLTLKFIFISISSDHAQTGLLADYAGGTQGVNSLIDQIWDKYELLDSGECGSVGTPAFNAECSELAHLMAHMSKLYRHLNLPMPKKLQALKCSKF